MSSEMTATNPDTVELQAESLLVDIKPSSEVAVNSMPSSESTADNQEQQWQPFWEKASTVFTYLSTYTNDFFKNYQPLLAVLGWLIAAVVTVKLTLAVLDAIHDIPLLSVILELIGLTAVTWFVARYLLSAANRQELLNEIKTFKEQILGL